VRDVNGRGKLNLRQFYARENLKLETSDAKNRILRGEMRIFSALHVQNCYLYLLMCVGSKEMERGFPKLYAGNKSLANPDVKRLVG